jgi:aspartate kinase
MKVMKFGGGCLRDGASFARAAEIIRDQAGPRAVIVSAAGGVTDMLLAGIKRAEAGEEADLPTLADLMSIHETIVREGIADPEAMEETAGALSEKFRRLEKLFMAVAFAGEISPSLKANILSYGERLAAIVLAGCLKSLKVAGAALDADEIGMVTEEASEDATVDLTEFRKAFAPAAAELFRTGTVPVITGYFGRTPEGRVSTFGRNGSDYSAAVVAAALDAAVLEVWKDVDAYMSADPDLVLDPEPVRRLSWEEAAELSYFGAKILHPRTFEPLSGKTVPIVIKSFLDPGKPGTEIRPRAVVHDEIVKSVTLNHKIALLRIHGPGVGFKPGVIGRIGRTLADAGVNIYSVITAQTCINLLVDEADAGRSLERIRAITNGIVQRVDLRDDIALVAVVGEGLLETPGVVARVLAAVSRAGINVEMMSTGASEVAAYIIVRRDRAAEAVRSIHRAFFEKRIDNGNAFTE